MPRPNRNAIIEADLDDDRDIDPNDFADEAEDNDDFGMADADSDDGLTVEEVAEQTRAFNEKQRLAVEKARKGRAAPAGPQRARTTKTQKVAAARAPVRARSVTEWKPSDTLDAPPPRPGMEHRFIRFRIGTDDDQKNFSSKQRGGWVPRLANTVPEGYFPPTMRHAQLGEVIAVGDLILCERPRSIGIAQKKYFQEKLRRQTQAGQRHIRKAQRSDHPIDVEETRERPSVGYGKKRRAMVQDDGE